MVSDFKMLREELLAIFCIILDVFTLAVKIRLYFLHKVVLHYKIMPRLYALNHRSVSVVKYNTT